MSNDASPTPPDSCAGAAEVPYDGIDQDCDGSDLRDVDGDGYDAAGVEGDDCDDADPTVHPSAEEIWYDGNDQDCDGSDDFDQDGDGYASADHGGDDCDDDASTVHIGALETWYDGIDQDCDGASDFDQDGDGYASADYSGDDCDDENPAVFPGAEEIQWVGGGQGAGIDEDCDGWTDERDVCPDGSGHFAGIQEAIDASASETTVVLVLCPRTWHESVSFSRLNLTIVGGGEEPDDVVWQPGDSAILIDAGDDVDTELHLENLYLLADGELNQTAVQAMGRSFSFHRVGIDGFGGWPNWAILLGSVEDTLDLVMTHTYLAGAGYGGVLVGGYGSSITVSIVASVFAGNSDYDVAISGGSEADGSGLPPISDLSLSITNSLFARPAWRSINFVDALAGDVVLSNNTFVGPLTKTYPSSQLIGSGYVQVNTTIDSNEFVDTESGYLWASAWCKTSDWGCLHEPRGTEADAWPDEFAYNIGWNAYANGLGVAAYGGDLGDSTFSGLSDMEAGITLVDPLLDAGTSPPYIHPAGSPAIDAGNPDPARNDPDGTRNDAGAYGGPGGDWWEESPWLTRL